MVQKVFLANTKVEGAAYSNYCEMFAIHYVGRTPAQPVGYLVQGGLKKWKPVLKYVNNYK